MFSVDTNKVSAIILSSEVDSKLITVTMLTRHFHASHGKHLGIDVVCTCEEHVHGALTALRHHEAAIVSHYRAYTRFTLSAKHLLQALIGIYLSRSHLCGVSLLHGIVHTRRLLDDVPDILDGQRWISL